MIKFDFNNVLTARVGLKHGLTESQIIKLAKSYSPVVRELQRERQKGEHPVLPHQTG